MSALSCVNSVLFSTLYVTFRSRLWLTKKLSTTSHRAQAGVDACVDCCIWQDRQREYLENQIQEVQREFDAVKRRFDIPERGQPLRPPAPAETAKQKVRQQR